MASKVLGYIVEPKNGGPIYLTFKKEVAEKRTRAGDMVTPYTSRFAPGEKADPTDKMIQRELEESDEEEL